MAKMRENPSVILQDPSTNPKIPQQALKIQKNLSKMVKWGGKSLNSRRRSQRMAETGLANGQQVRKNPSKDPKRIPKYPKEGEATKLRWRWLLSSFQPSSSTRRRKQKREKKRKEEEEEEEEEEKEGKGSIRTTMALEAANERVVAFQIWKGHEFQRVKHKKWIHEKGKCPLFDDVHSEVMALFLGPPLFLFYHLLPPPSTFFHLLPPCCSLLHRI